MPPTLLDAQSDRTRQRLRLHREKHSFDLFQKHVRFKTGNLTATEVTAFGKPCPMFWRWRLPSVWPPWHEMARDGTRNTRSRPKAFQPSRKRPASKLQVVGPAEIPKLQREIRLQTMRENKACCQQCSGANEKEVLHPPQQQSMNTPFLLVQNKTAGPVPAPLTRLSACLTSKSDMSGGFYGVALHASTAVCATSW